MKEDFCIQKFVKNVNMEMENEYMLTIVIFWMHFITFIFCFEIFNILWPESQKTITNQSFYLTTIKRIAQFKD